MVCSPELSTASAVEALLTARLGEDDRVNVA
jgi:hypothetical protein